jgi:hypothetical protein
MYGVPPGDEVAMRLPDAWERAGDSPLVFEVPALAEPNTPTVRKLPFSTVQWE